ncbi:hypothetical protein [Kribbella sp. NPDC048915]|uniref:hypothetical protein n=1 Tax=Kribbella sp. NPDC048915 TaxID=3155148 RepID=UPI0033C1EF97
MDDHDDRLPGRQPHTVDQPQAADQQTLDQQTVDQQTLDQQTVDQPTVDQDEIAELQRFLWSHTAPGRQSSARAGDGARPDNVRPLRPAERPERGAE